MAVTCVIGLQWGDEAKGKVVDLLAPRYDVVARYLGGANAGHTVVVGGEKFKLHHIPSGILAENVKNVVAAGVVINPPIILNEMDSLTDRGIRVGDNLMLSDRAHIVCPWHIAEDQVMDSSPVAGESIGTTLRGIGPCYRDKVGRSFAIRLGDLLRDDLRQRVEEVVEVKLRMLAGLDQSEGKDFGLEPQQIYADFRGYADRLRPFVGDSTEFLLSAIESRADILFEGAQGAMLDIDHGTFPFVTSSNSSGAGVSAGSGVPLRHVDNVIGVTKAYTTRVGGGPFPTELENDIGQQIRDDGAEYGTTTGRPRRCGWFDGVAVRYASRLSGIDTLAIMKLDVLSRLPELELCVAYEFDGQRSQHFPGHVEDLRRAKPVFEKMPGWQQDIREVRKMTDLPANARRYLDRIAELVGHPVALVSVGPDREQTVLNES
jgi:adenylosuccinate synthase